MPEENENSVLPELELTQFTKIPYVDFNTTKVGTQRKAGLKIKNPEKFQASFTVDMPKFLKTPSNLNGIIESDKPFDEIFTLEPEAEEVVNFFWTPEKPGNIREMIEIRVSAGRQFSVRAYLVGSAEAPPQKKKKSAKGPSIRKPFGPRQEAAGGQRSDATFAVPALPPPAIRMESAGATTGGENRTYAVAASDAFVAASGAGGRAVLSAGIDGQQSPRRETFIVHTKTTLKHSKEVIRSPVKGERGDFDQLFTSEESVVEEETTLEVQEQEWNMGLVAEGRNFGGLRRSVTYDVDIATASDNAAVFEPRSLGADPMNSTVAPAGQMVENIFPTNVQISAIGPRKQSRFVETPNNGGKIPNPDFEDHKFLKPYTPDRDGRRKAAVKKLDLANAEELDLRFRSRSASAGRQDGAAMTMDGGGDRTRSTEHMIRGKDPEREWVIQQERGFTVWLNCILTANFDEETEGEEPKVLSKEEAKRRLVMLETENVSRPAPTKETVSLKLYSVIRNLTELRTAGKRLWTELTPLIHTFTQAVADKKFSLRADCFIHADVGLRVRMMEILSSVAPLWLRLGLETVYGEVIPLSSQRDTMGLQRFVLDRLLSDPMIQKKHAHATLKNIIRTDEQKAEMGRLFLKRFACLLIFLDKAKTEKIIKHDPCLFVHSKRGEFKSIEGLFRVLITEYMSGDGNILKYLKRHGYTPTYRQTPLEEYRYSVNQIGTQLRDGVILIRVVKLLTGNDKYCAKVLCPPVDVNRKKHNMELVFKTLTEEKLVNLDGLNPKHIVEGSREKTLEFLWRLVLQFQIKVLFVKEDITEEIERLKTTFNYEQRKVLSSIPIPDWDSAEIRLLFQWTRMVCMKKHIMVKNFGSSYEDGKALCSLISYYQPKILNGDLDWDDAEECWDAFFNGMKELGGVPKLIDVPEERGGLCEKTMILYLSILCGRLLTLRKETRASVTIQVAWRKYRFRKNLAEALRVVRSVRIIQTRWRATLAMRKERKKYLDILAATSVIKSYWRRTGRFMIFYRKVRALLHLHRSARTIQAAWRGYVARKEVRQMDVAARKVTEFLRMCGDRKRFLALKRRAVFIAERRRAVLLMREERRRQKAAAVIQRTWRNGGRFLLIFRTELNKHKQARKLQAAWRGYSVRRELKRRDVAAKRLTEYFWMRKERRTFLEKKEATVMIQKNLRMAFARRQYVVMRDARREKVRRNGAATLIQSWIRMRRQRAKFLERKEEMRKETILGRIERLKAKKIQRWYKEVLRARAEREAASVKIAAFMRMARDRKRFVLLRAVSSVFAARWKAQIAMREERRRYLLLKKSVVFLQSSFRMMVVRRQFISWKEERERERRNLAALTIQKNVRMWRAKRELDRLRKERKKYLIRVGENIRIQLSAIMIQRRMRLILARRQAQKELRSAVRIQNWWRCAVMRKKFLRLKKSVLCVQSHVRGTVCREEYMRKKRSAVTIQALWRGYRTRKRVRQNHLRIQHIEERLRLVTRRAKDSQRLGQRTRRSLDYILSMKSLTNIRTALTELEVTSRLSPESCVRIARSGGIPILLRIILEMNRSVACESVNEVAAQVLLNIAKYDRTAHFVVDDEHWVDAVVHLMVAKRPKASGCEEEKVFVMGAQIFISLSHLPEAQLKVASNEELKKKIVSWNTLLQRAHDVEQKQQSQKVLSSELDRTIARKQMHKLELLDREMLDVTKSPFTPAWVLRKEKATEVMSALFAIKYMRNRYGI